MHPVWSPTHSEPTSEEFVARCLLGAGWVSGTRRLSMLDLRVWAALCAMLREQWSAAPDDDPTLDRVSSRTVGTTGYQLADAAIGSEGGAQWRSLRRSLRRLKAAEITVRTVERDEQLAVEVLHEGLVSLVGEVWSATTRLDLTHPRQWGALKAGTSLRVEIGRWPAEQVLAGRCTWLDLDLLRELGPGLPARLWCALEAWARWPAHTLDGGEETAIGLGEPALQSLGVGGYGRAQDARSSLNRAGARIVAVDPSYELIRCEKRAGWCLIVRRVSGARARAAARRDAPWRSQGIVAAKRQRPERVSVRAAINASLADGASKPF